MVGYKIFNNKDLLADDIIHGEYIVE